MKKDSLFVPLENLEKLYRDTAGIDYKTYNNKYKGQIGYLMKDQPTLVPFINNMNFINSKSLIKLARKYHKLSCNGEDCIEYAKNDTAVKFKWGIGVSYGLPNLTLNSTTIPNYSYNILYNLNWRFNSNKQYGINFPFEIIFKSFSRKLSFNISPGIFKTDFKSVASTLYINTICSSIININITSVDFPFYLKYSLNSLTWKIWPYIGFGFKYSRFINTKSSFKIIGYSSEYYSSDFKFSKYQDALFITSGFDLPVKSHKINFCVSWEEGDGICEGKFLNNFRKVSKTSMFTMSAAYVF